MGCRVWLITFAEFVSHEVRSDGVCATASVLSDSQNPQIGRVAADVDLGPTRWEDGGGARAPGSCDGTRFDRERWSWLTGHD